MLPGLIDAHAHFGNFSSQAIGAQILPPPDAGAKNIDAIISILKEWNTPENRALTGWIFGAGFDDSVMEDKRFPTKHDLDKVTTEFPIMIIHISGHFAVVNSKGLELLKTNSSEEEYIQIEYLENEILYVPIRQAYLVSKFQVKSIKNQEF